MQSHCLEGLQRGTANETLYSPLAYTVKTASARLSR